MPLFETSKQLLEQKYRHIFWSLCGAHCFNNLLEDIGDLFIHKATTENARKIMVFIERHSLVWSIMRSFDEIRQHKHHNYLTMWSIQVSKKALKTCLDQKRGSLASILEKEMQSMWMQSIQFLMIHKILFELLMTIGGGSSASGWWH